MAEFLLGMLGMLLMLSAFVCGIVLGVKYGPNKNVRAEEEELSVEEREEKKRRREEEQLAFEAQMNYSPAVAYRMTREEREEL